MPLAERMQRRPRSRLAVARRQRDAQQRSNFFLDLDDGFGTRQAQCQTGIIPLKTDNFGGKWVGITGLRAAFAGLQCAEALPASRCLRQSVRADE